MSNETEILIYFRLAAITMYALHFDGVKNHIYNYRPQVCVCSHLGGGDTLIRPMEGGTPSFLRGVPPSFPTGGTPILPDRKIPPPAR